MYVSIGHGLLLHYKGHPCDDSVAVILRVQRLVCVCVCVSRTWSGAAVQGTSL